jgi:hypothetical protein
VARLRTKTGQGDERFVDGRAERLPFADGSIDLTTCITALCFIAEERQALREMLRVTRQRLVLGLLNRSSLLHLKQGCWGGRGSYRDAHWHTAAEVRARFRRLPARRLVLRSAIFLPGGGRVAQSIEHVLPTRLLLGGFLAAAENVEPGKAMPIPHTNSCGGRDDVDELAKPGDRLGRAGGRRLGGAPAVMRILVAHHAARTPERGSLRVSHPNPPAP